MPKKLIEVPNITCYMGYVIWTHVYLAQRPFIWWQYYMESHHIQGLSSNFSIWGKCPYSQNYH